MSRAATENKIQVIDGQIDLLLKQSEDLDRILAELLRTKASVATRLETLQSTKQDLVQQIQPINSLHVELLIHVFNFLCMDDDGPGDKTYCSPAVTISHVCRKWRHIALSTSEVWSQLYIQCTGWNTERVSAFLERSGCAPLRVVFGNCNLSCKESRVARTRNPFKLVELLEDQSSRLKSLSIECSSFKSSGLTLSMFNDLDKTFPVLTSLNLAWTATTKIVFPFDGRSTSEMGPPDQDLIARTKTLKHIRLEHIPLLTVPLHFFCSLRSLEIAFPPNVSVQNSLRLTHLIIVLSNSQQLEELSLSDAILPLILPSEDVPPGATLPLLKRFEWSFPQAWQVKHFLSLISMPVLEKLDLWINDERKIVLRRIEVPLSTINGSEAARTRPYLNANIGYPSLHELSVQYSDSDSITTVLRSFAAPFLKKLEITNMGDTIARGKKDGSRTPLELPKFESVFRDPRLPFLTHLTLSHVWIGERGRLEGQAEVMRMLGYMPALTSLSLDSVSNVSVIIEALSQKQTVTVSVAAIGLVKSINGTQTFGQQARDNGGIRGGDTAKMKFCPLLEALSFWNCDITFPELHYLVFVRNRYRDSIGRSYESNGHRDGDADVDIDSGKNFRVRNRAMEYGVGSDAKDASGSENTNTSTANVPQRTIRPLRKKARTQGQSALNGAQALPGQEARFSSTSSASASVVAAMMARVDLESEPARVVYVRTVGCRQITQRNANSLKVLGVVDVLWSGES